MFCAMSLTLQRILHLFFVIRNLLFTCVELHELRSNTLINIHAYINICILYRCFTGWSWYLTTKQEFGLHRSVWIRVCVENKRLEWNEANQYSYQQQSNASLNAAVGPLATEIARRSLTTCGLMIDCRSPRVTSFDTPPAPSRYATLVGSVSPVAGPMTLDDRAKKLDKERYLLTTDAANRLPAVTRGICWLRHDVRLAGSGRRWRLSHGCWSSEFRFLFLFWWSTIVKHVSSCVSHLH